VADQEWVQLNLARVHAKLELVKLINWKVAAAGGANPADASATKVFATEFYTEAYRLLMEVLGPSAYLTRASTSAALAGRLERAFQGCLILTFGGGVNEVQRDLIALFGAGLPRVPRT
jgi:3-oxocholest-4-en-26-oyl-CoA dehydrogenase alpha subunit